jgi:hypothetical protein
MIYELNESDINRIKKETRGFNAWLNCDLMEILPRLLVKSMKDIKLSDCYIINTYDTNSLFKDQSTSKQLEKICVNDYKYVFGFWELDKHWRLLFGDISNYKFYYLDPMYLDTSFDSEHQTWTKFANSKSKTNISWTPSSFTKRSKQKDSFNCGVICIMLLEQLLLNKTDAFLFEKEDLIKYREKLYNLILKYKKN